MIGRFGITGSARLYRLPGDVRIGNVRPCVYCNKIFVAIRSAQNGRVFAVCQSCGNEGEKAENSTIAIDYWNSEQQKK